MTEESPRLYVGNLPYVAQKHDIERLFEDNNINIESPTLLFADHSLSKKIDMSIDPFTGRNPSYCFVDFHDHETAQQVLNTMQGLNVRGRPIRINLKTERRQGAGQRPDTRTYDRGWKPKDLPSRDADPDTAYAFDRWNRDDAQSHWIAPLEERRRLWITGLPRIPNQDSLNVEMRELFAQYNVEAVSKLISPHHSEQGEQGSHYSCFVDLADGNEAKNAITMFDGMATPYGKSLLMKSAL
ncbi:hypothetical protein CLAFUW4_14657 [Fulvia fulva]|uniref:RRM domain-containing protein n=1 Tax=Passalora fulva TaxID=5499 RepID=A0A9Q8PMT3_PASFU|nr:uncharacterized protein CLAFUR5_14485 [Fulvia fulva]KAK4609327.1 hypothetical protein CLAFUR4_14651 [Fulvia fulva]KAK4609625.1 hypothetical protein CLAFUR0_14650 [Fulvia fulva]UJO25321.1 hypothetical protein CLAFUR5_14485 [Fulvia fulva]WPV22418.1 hypothetical protein CLAFUW4_14657 [Fulvia fulva]WPV37737.1 hypothetical protein CLAFUW7_14660 [Fulvia fulva]